MVNLKELNFFKNFPPALLESMGQCAHLVNYEAGDAILKQGQHNESLFFLLKGTLGVFVDGGQVATLTEKGDLIGEMSLLSKQEVTATILAQTPVEMCRIDANALLNYTDEQGRTIEYSLYKIYSDVLRQKLEETNHKAKHFEELSRGLKKAQAELLQVNQFLEQKVKSRTNELQARMDELEQSNLQLSTSHEKLKELYTNRDATFEALQTLLHENLIPLQKGINILKGDEEHQNISIIEAEEEIKRAIERLSPLTLSYNNEKSMKSKRVLVAESVLNQRIVAKMALGGTGVQLDIVTSLAEGIEKLTTSVYDIVLFDRDMTEISIMAKQRNPQARFVFVTSQDIPEYTPILKNHPFFPNVVSRDENDRQFTIKNFTTTVTKLASNNLFGMEKYLSWGVEIKEHEVIESGERHLLNQSMANYFKNSGMRPSMLDRCVAVTEELLMNAIYDAPRNRLGEPLYNHIDRTKPISLAKNHRALFRYATDGMIMAVSVEDPFGALDIKTVFNYLERCYSGGASLNDGNTRKAGGGRGLHQIIENSDLVVFNVDPGHKTEVIAFFNTDPNVRESRNPNLHFFTTSDAA